MNYFIIAISILFSNFTLYAQDERVFRDFFLGKYSEKDFDVETYKNLKDKWRVSTPMYRIDLDNDGLLESILVEKSDGKDWFHILGNDNLRLFSLKLSTKGSQSYLHKVHIKQLSKGIKLLLLHFYEGYTEYFDFLGTSRIYFVTIEDNDLTKIYSYAGPYIFSEHRNFKKSYGQKIFDISLYDYNNDGVREVIVGYNKIKRVFAYLQKGKWSGL